MIRGPPRSTRTDTLLPYTTLLRSGRARHDEVDGVEDGGIGALDSGLLLQFPERRLRHPLAPVDLAAGKAPVAGLRRIGAAYRSEEHTSELQSLMRNSYVVFCFKKKKIRKAHCWSSAHHEPHI